jgi:hypothetical protein
VVSDQVELYETITGEHHAGQQGGQPGSDPHGPGAAGEEPGGGEVVPMPKRKEGER